MTVSIVFEANQVSDFNTGSITTATEHQVTANGSQPCINSPTHYRLTVTANKNSTVDSTNGNRNVVDGESPIDIEVSYDGGVTWVPAVDNLRNDGKSSDFFIRQDEEDWIIIAWDDSNDSDGQGAMILSRNPIADGDVFTTNEPWYGALGIAPQINEFLLCFASGTMISCEDGVQAIDNLKIGDWVETADNGFQQIRWIGNSYLSADDLIAKPYLRPIEISEGAMGYGFPENNLIVSPLHRMVVEDWRADYLFSENRVMMTAKSLVNGQDIKVCDTTEGVKYFHILFDEHEVIYANGAASESFLPGETSLSVLDEKIQNEIFEIFPELRSQTAETYKPACVLLKSFEAQVLKGFK